MNVGREVTRLVLAKVNLLCRVVQHPQITARDEEREHTFVKPDSRLERGDDEILEYQQHPLPATDAALGWQHGIQLRNLD